MTNSSASTSSYHAHNASLFQFRGVVPSTVFSRMPKLHGRRIHVTFRPSLTAHRGKLLSKSMKGDAVYAGCFLRKRRIILDEQMLKTPRILERIFVHEVFHFVWSKLSPAFRASYEKLIIGELRRRAKGELGWSAESMKVKLAESDVVNGTRRWKDYLCESFCDTAGWIYGSARPYSERTLARHYRDSRRRWFRKHLLEKPLSI